jgi:hypothetical protein
MPTGTLRKSESDVYHLVNIYSLKNNLRIGVVHGGLPRKSSDCKGGNYQHHAALRIAINVRAIKLFQVNVAISLSADFFFIA